MDDTNIGQQFNRSDPDIMYKLGSIEAQLKSLNEKLDVKEKQQDLEIISLKADVGKLKEFKNIQLGIAASVSFIVGILTKVVPWQNLF